MGNGFLKNQFGKLIYKKMKKRIIARLDIKKDTLIKGVHLEGLRVVGDPKKFALKYYFEGVDEILLLDSVATLHGRNALSKSINYISENIFIPITVGGGITNIKQARELFNSGADKITINTGAVENKEIIKELSDNFGSQALVLSIQAKKYNNQWNVMTYNGREKNDMKVEYWIEIAQELGIGEIMLTSIDQEGTGLGFDLELLKLIKKYQKLVLFVVEVLVINGKQRIAYKNGVDAIACARSFHYDEMQIKELKKFLVKENISVVM